MSVDIKEIKIKDFKKPYNILIIGSRACGKSTLLKKFFEEYKTKYVVDGLDKSLSPFKDITDNIYTKYSELNKVLSSVLHIKTESLCIGVENYIDKKLNVYLENYISRGISTIITNQGDGNFGGCKFDYIIFKTKNNRLLKKIYTNYVNSDIGDFDTFRALYKKHVSNDTYTWMVIDYKYDIISYLK